ncbi:MAG: HDOD domain-containing protein [Nitrospinae bacterium]|nr:HDOD domain-containing protein [Nitrospinota bacterium]
MLEQTSLAKEKRRILIQRIKDIPTLPSSIHKIIQLADDSSSTPTALAEAISKDPSISSLILRLVNSAFYGHYRQISSISRAVVILGYKTVKTMALGVSIFQGTSARGRQVFNRKDFWTHSLGVATFTKKLAVRFGGVAGVDGETLFLSGLLHDIGKVAFDNYFNEEFAEAAAEAQKNGEWIGIPELKYLGMDHSEAGYYLARTWNFPPQVISGVRFHHSVAECPKEDGMDKAAAVVSIADYVCRKLKIGSGGDNVEAPLFIEALNLCGITPGDVEALAVDAGLLADKEMIESFVSAK